MRSSSNGTAMTRASKTIATAVTKKTTDHFLRAVRGSLDGRRSVEALWEGGIVAEDGAVFRTTGRTEVEVIRCTSLGPVLLSGVVKPLAPGWEQGRADSC